MQFKESLEAAQNTKEALDRARDAYNSAGDAYRRAGGGYDAPHEMCAAYDKASREYDEKYMAHIKARAFFRDLVLQME